MNLLESTCTAIQPRDHEWEKRALARLEQLTMPHWALGRLMDLSLELAGMTSSLTPSLSRRVIVTMAGDHGVTEEEVSAYPPEVTQQMVLNIIAGGAGVNALAQTTNAQVHVVDMGITESPEIESVHFSSKRIGPGTKNMAHGAAMTREEAIRSIEAGIEVAEFLSNDVDIFGTGDMGIGNTTASTAIAAVLTDKSIDELTGPGTGLDAKRIAHKASVVQAALALNKPNPADPVDVLAKVGGFEIGGICGLILGAAAMRKPVVLDGFISTAGALLAHALVPESADYMVAAHRSAELGHCAMLETIGKQPLLDLDLRLGEGTGAALALGIIDASVALLSQVRTFEEAAVSSKSDGDS